MARSRWLRAVLSVASVRARRDSGLLFLDFIYRDTRCRELTLLKDSAANRKKLRALADRIQAEITLGTFDYARYFPNSPRAARFEVAERSSVNRSNLGGDTAPFDQWVDTWFEQNKVQWRKATQESYRSAIDRHLKPHFQGKDLSEIAKADVLDLRAALANRPGRGGNSSLAPKTINYTLNLLSMVMAEASDQFDQVSNPCSTVKRLKQRRPEIHPFTLAEVNLILQRVRADFRDYYTARFLTGMRTGEVHGLKWKHVDFTRREILVRETFSRGRVEYTKTDGSQREIAMASLVHECLRARRDAVNPDPEDLVFPSDNGTPLNVNNVTNRVWYPLLRHLGLPLRRPYQCRHTAATLWLAAGENPEWIARQLGHVSTEMLFKTYSRYVPNLTRQDGTAFERVLAQVNLAPVQARG